MTISAELTAFGTSLKQALSRAHPGEHILDAVRGALTENGPSSEESAEADDVWRLAHRFDASLCQLDRPEPVVELTSDLVCLIEGGIAAETIELLLDVVASRGELADLLDRFATGRISRTGVVGYIDSRPWPREIRQTLRRWSGEDPKELSGILRNRDCAGWVRLLEQR